MNRLPGADLARGATGLAAAAISHVGWWLDWQTPARVGQGCRALDDLA